MVHEFTGGEGLLWLRPPKYGGGIFGPFTNPNHFALHMLLLLGLSLGLFYAMLRRLRPLVTGDSMIERVRSVPSGQAGRVLLGGFATILFMAGVLASRSRGGILSMGGGLGCLVLLLAVRARQGRGRYLWAIGSALLLLVATFLWMGWHDVIEELGTLREIAADPLANARSQATRDTLRVFGAFPVTGSGFGSFQYIFPAFAGPELAFGRWLHAHNDWAQLLAEGGCIGALLWFTALFLFAREVLGTGRRAIVPSRAFVAGMVAGLGGVALHSFLDYGLHKPANAILLSAMAGLCVAAVHLHLPVAVPGRTVSEPGLLCAGRRACCVMVRLSGCLLAVGLTRLVIYQGVEFRRELASARFDHVRWESRMVEAGDRETMDRIVASGRDEVPHLVAVARANPTAAREAANMCFRWSVDRDVGGEQRQLAARDGFRLAMAACEAGSTDPLCWEWLTRACGRLGLWDEMEWCHARAREVGSRSELFR
jgi:O-antigen ligase